MVHRVEEFLDVHFHDDAVLPPLADDLVEATHGLVSAGPRSPSAPANGVLQGSEVARQLHTVYNASVTVL